MSNVLGIDVGKAEIMVALLVDNKYKIDKNNWKCLIFYDLCKYI